MSKKTSKSVYNSRSSCEIKENFSLLTRFYNTREVFNFNGVKLQCSNGVYVGASVTKLVRCFLQHIMQ